MESDLLFGRNPISISAATIFGAACGQDYRSLAQVAEVSGVNVKTIKTIYEIIKDLF